MEFAHPLYLLLLLLLIPAIVWYVLRQKYMQASLQVSTTMPFDKLPRSYKYYLRHFNFGLRLLAIAFLIVALARPQSTDNWSETSTEGIDIVLALDVSTSMNTRDFNPNRIEVAKDVAAKFISQRKSDNIGLVVFAGETFTMCPMTTDHAVLLNLMKDVRCEMIVDGTAIGDGLATAINRIKDGPAKSKAIILLTDGSNNAGNVSPIVAAQIAKEYGIRVYTIGVGADGPVNVARHHRYYGQMDYQQVDNFIDEKTLNEIATITDGTYFRATENHALQDIFEEIDQMEKTKFLTQNINAKEEEYPRWVLLSLLCLLLNILLRQTILKNIP